MALGPKWPQKRDFGSFFFFSIFGPFLYFFPIHVGPRLRPSFSYFRLSARFPIGKIEWGGFPKGGFSNNRCVLKPDVAIASEVLILSKNSLAITDFRAKKTQHVQLIILIVENPLPATPPVRDSQFYTRRTDSQFEPLSCCLRRPHRHFP